ncbi:iron-containing alcohol dehydrogenase family protein [Spirosoma montaniterrae]|uniref:Alcohol dehydrogenase n=1 Tax=Spirosoma montaniterrae TaxID=1178516 RepID=A0A1P9X3G5_9BACT|nr:iron-containing alcohol dehydrogenase family protein [Spirosoma montaniterrae]AQG82148.1 alcohol dehydrogenase [Spirosoma montaniterrae]
MHKNFKGVEKTVFGRGSFDQLGDILAPHRTGENPYMVFLVDAYFNGKPLESRVPAQNNDLVYYISVEEHEPTTEQIDTLRDEILAKQGLPAGVVGIGGGSIMDIAKALSLMLTNEGSSTLYQGLNLIKKPGVYHVGVPTISGTGAEVSMTAVLTGPEKKLGLKCEWTVFDQIVLDPDLIATVPRDWWFYTGMDTYIHCVESENGQFNNAYSHAFAEQSLALCREIFSKGQTPETDEKLMVASLMGGLSLTYSEVGVCHALSYGLSKILGTRHCYANCLIMNHLDDYYPEGVAEFKQFVAQHNITLPQNLSAEWDDDTITKMAEVSYNLPHMWNHAIGYDWKNTITMDVLKDLFRRL